MPPAEERRRLGTPEPVYQLPPLSFASAEYLRSPNNWRADLQELDSSPSQWGRQVDSIFRGIVPPPSTPTPSSLPSRATSSLDSESTRASEFSLGSSGFSQALDNLLADETDEEPTWRELVADTMRFLSRLSGRAWALLRAPWGPPHAPPSPPASDGDSTQSLSDIASSGSLTAVEDEDSELERIDWRLRY